MTECKHRWIEQNWGKPYRAPNIYMYYCARCHQARIARLIGADHA